MNEIEVKEEGDEGQYSLQTLLKNEPIEQSIETLLNQDQKIVARLENLLIMFDKVRDIQQQRENMLSYIESIIVAKIERISSIPSPDFRLTLPPIISKNFQLYEFLLACLQSHPCYMAKLVELNPHLSKNDAATLFKAVYGDMCNSPQKLRKLMLLHKLTLKISASKIDFHRILKMKAGGLSASIYFFILESQQANNIFYAGLASEVMKIVHFVSTFGENYKEKLKETEKSQKNDLTVKTDEGEIKKSEEKDDEKITEEAKKEEKTLEEQQQEILINLNEAKHKIRDALNFKQLEQLGDLAPELKSLYEQRKKLYSLATNRVKKTIYNILTYDPKTRSRIAKDQKLSNEVKFMYKDIPSVFKERFQGQCETVDGKCILDSKIVLLFFAPLVEILREPIRLKRISLLEFEKSMGKIDFEEFIKTYSTGFTLIADYIEDLGEWKKRAHEEEKKTQKDMKNTKDSYSNRCNYRKLLVKELTDVPDLNLTDLSLEDMLTTSLEPDDSSLTISLENLCNLHLLLKSNINIIRNEFGEDDPVFIIISSLGKVKDLFKKLLLLDTKSIKMNLKLPIR